MHPYLRLRILARPTAANRDAPWSAPLLRRVLGKALIDTHCPFGRPHCQPPATQKGPAQQPEDLCHIARSCPYGVVYAGSRNPRPPLALYTPAGPHRDAVAQLELTLPGDAWRHYPWMLAALARGLAAGVGKQRTPWRLVRVDRLRPDRSAETLCGEDLTALPPTLAPDLLGVGLEPYLAPQPVVVRLLSATRLVHEKKLLPPDAPVPFAALVARILDRFQGLYGDGASEILRPEIRAVVEAEAERVPLAADETRWTKVHDYSARGDREIDLGGKEGRLVYGPEAARFVPILRAGEILHVGKNPTAGCGRMEVELG